MPTTLAEQRATLLGSANTIVAAAKAANRPMTDSEATEVEGFLSQIEELDQRAERVKRSTAIWEGISRLDHPGLDDDPDDDRTWSSGPTKHLALTSSERRGAASKLAQTMLTKGLTVVGDAITDIPVAGPIPQGRIPTTILDVLPVVVQSGPVFRYLRQSSRVFNAAVVAPGAPKPESNVGVTSVDMALRVIAHVASGINAYDMLDSPALSRWLGDEMLYGLGLAVEKEVLLGDGTTGHLQGILSHSGIQTQAAGPDVVTTIRSSITKLQSLGYQPGAVILHPTNWEKANITRAATSGVFDFAPGAPVDAAAQRLWGVPVVLSPTITVNVGVVLDTATVAVNTDTQGVRVQWSEFDADDFVKNLLKVRAEGRFGVSVYQPTGVVKATLPA